MQDVFVGDFDHHGIGVKLGGASADRVAFVYNFMQTMFSWGDVGIFHDAYIQGVTVSQSNFVGNRFGYYMPSGTGTSQLSITSSQFEVIGAAIAVTNAHGLMITGNQITVDIDFNIGIKLTSVGDFTITNNTFLQTFGSAGTVAVQIDSEIPQSIPEFTPGLISGNAFKGYAIGINYPNAGTYFDKIVNNRYGVTSAGTVLNAAAKSFSEQPISFTNAVPCSATIRNREQQFTNSNTAAWGDDNYRRWRPASACCLQRHRLDRDRKIECANGQGLCG